VIVDERLVTYINSLDTGNTALLDQIEKEATEQYVPIIRKEMQTLFKAAACDEETGAYFGSGNGGGIFCASDGGI